jgi:hypothetical protein
MTSRLPLIAFSVAMLGAVVSLPMSAAACPAGSRFSVKPDGTNPICIVIGQGLKLRARCFEMPKSGRGLGGVVHKSNQAPGHLYCCPG